VTITGELADCYATKKEGITHISSVVKGVFPDALFYGYDGHFYHDTVNHHLFSASNWSASARYIGRVHGDVIFIDTGSTTTDIIPVIGGIPAAAPTDFGRLSRGELVYSGALRTNLSVLLGSVYLRGTAVRTASELFAITGDIYLLLGRITADDYTCEAPDSGLKDTTGSARRIARLVCCDLEELGMDDVMQIARQAYRKQVDDIKAAINEVSQKHGLSKAVVCGMGSFIARDALFEMEIPFNQIQNERISRVFPAYAVAQLVAEDIK